ncbi:hypothetical protein KEM55_002855 [Ascosphaera atra]|nr:hypothetical protein KEM55_002855 [Ascosphaera atra]
MGFFKRAARLHRNYSREEKDTSSSAPSIAALHSQLSLVSAATSSQSRSKMPPAPDPNVNPVAYLKSIHAVRDRSKLVMNKAKSNTLNHFDVDHSKFEETAKYVVSIIKRDYAPDYSKIPPHGRWQHFDVGGRPRIKQLLQSWPTTVNAIERTRRLLDLRRLRKQLEVQIEGVRKGVQQERGTCGCESGDVQGWDVQQGSGAAVSGGCGWAEEGVD